MLYQALDEVLGTTTKVRLLRVLLRLGSPVSAREAQRLAGVRSSQALGQALAQLTQLGVLDRQVVGNVHLYAVRSGFTLEAPLRALFEAESERPDHLYEIVSEAIHGMSAAEEVRGVILFGSAARGEARPDSDVDLLVTIRNEEGMGRAEDAMRQAEEQAAERLGLRLSPYIITVPRLRERHRAGDPLMLSIEREGRRFFGDSFEEMLRW